MRSRDVVGRKIVKVIQERLTFEGCTETRVYSFLLDNGGRIDLFSVPTADITEVTARYRKPAKDSSK